MTVHPTIPPDLITLFLSFQDKVILSPYFQEKALPLREIINRLENVYCGSIGAEFMHIHDLDQAR